MVCPCGLGVPVLPALAPSQVCWDTNSTRRRCEHGQFIRRKGLSTKWWLSEQVRRAVSTSYTVTCAFSVMLHTRYGHWWSEISNCEVILGKVGGHFPLFPLCFLPSAPAQCLFTFPFSSTLHLSHISSDMAWCDFDRDEGVVGKALRIVFHWKEECIMPHGEENTNTFWLDKASSNLKHPPSNLF